LLRNAAIKYSTFMDPILVFRHVRCEGPGYLGSFLSARDVAYEVIRVDEGGRVPRSLDGVSGLVFMGGPMSVNDACPWIDEELALIRLAHDKKLPVLGHCLGGQLISKALGGDITSNPLPEIGWFEVSGYRNRTARRWLDGLPGNFEVFHLHGETFSLPRGAQPLLKSRYCPRQAFVHGNSLALQCHVEITESMLREWVTVYRADIRCPSESVQTEGEILAHLDKRIPALQVVADHLYTRWLEGLAPAGFGEAA